MFGLVCDICFSMCLAAQILSQCPQVLVAEIHREVENKISALRLHAQISKPFKISNICLFYHHLPCCWGFPMQEAKSTYENLPTRVQDPRSSGVASLCRVGTIAFSRTTLQDWSQSTNILSHSARQAHNTSHPHRETKHGNVSKFLTFSDICDIDEISHRAGFSETETEITTGFAGFDSV